LKKKLGGSQKKNSCRGRTKGSVIQEVRKKKLLHSSASQHQRLNIFNGKKGKQPILGKRGRKEGWASTVALETSLQILKRHFLDRKREK